jgi:hypothetical protein
MITPIVSGTPRRAHVRHKQKVSVHLGKSYLRVQLGAKISVIRVVIDRFFLMKIIFESQPIDSFLKRKVKNKYDNFQNYRLYEKKIKKDYYL